jgi:general secretion pathway protein D
MIRFPSRHAVALVSTLLLVACATARLRDEAVADLQEGNYEVGLQKLEQVVKDAPDDLSYRVELKGAREEAVRRLIAEADKARSTGQFDAAEASYRRVLGIEAGNSRATAGLVGLDADRRHTQLVILAQQDLEHGDFEAADARLRTVLSEDPGNIAAAKLQNKIAQARGPMLTSPRLKTQDNRPVTLQFREAPTKAVFEVLSRQTGINFIFDKDVRSDGKTTIYVQDVPVEQAIDLVIGQNQLARQILSSNMVLIYPNNSAKQKDYQDEIVKTFYLNSTSPKEVEGILKTVLAAKTLVINERANAIVMRDTPENVRMAEKLVASIDVTEPEVMLEVEVLEISRSKLQQLGIAYPGSVTFTPTAPGVGNLTLDDLKNQNSSTITVSPLSITLDALKNTSASNTLASPRIRARNKEKAKILIGSRVPVITTAASASGNGGVVSNTNVQYLDIGLTLDVEPTIYPDANVSIRFHLEVSTIIKQLVVPSGNGGTTIAYEIGARNASTLLQLKDGETQILAGLVQDSDTRGASAIPGLGDIPVVGRLFSDHNTNRGKTEIVLSITPRIIRSAQRPGGDISEFWFGTESRSGVGPLGGAAGVAGTAIPVSTATAQALTIAPASSDVSSTGAGATTGAALPLVTAAGGPMVVTSAAVTSALPMVREAQNAPLPHTNLTLDGPSDVKAGDTFDVTVSLQGDPGARRLRAQVRFDGAALQLVGAEPGDVVPSSLNPRVQTLSGGAQLDVTATSDAPFSSGGTLMKLHFKALQARPLTAIAAQLSVVGNDGVSLVSNSPAPLKLVVAK